MLVAEDTWDDHIHSLMLAYRSSVHKSTNFKGGISNPARLQSSVIYWGFTRLGQPLTIHD